MVQYSLSFRRIMMKNKNAAAKVTAKMNVRLTDTVSTKIMMEHRK